MGTAMETEMGKRSWLGAGWAGRRWDGRNDPGELGKAGHCQGRGWGQLKGRDRREAAEMLVGKIPAVTRGQYLSGH